MEIKKYPMIPMHSLVCQKIKLQKKYSCGVCEIRRGILYWDGWLCPTPVSMKYHVQMQYKKGKRPIALLLGRNLKGLNIRDFPHRFISHKGKQGIADQYAVRMCLHLNCEFTGIMWLADTIVPWTMEWLYFYEIWLAIGKWCGGGVHVYKKKGLVTI